MTKVGDYAGRAMSATDGAGWRDLLRTAAQALTGAGVPTPEVDAELLAAWTLGTSRGDVALAALRGDHASASVAESFTAAVTRRAGREPLQHITGEAPFRHLLLAVGPGVFVPRPETELLAQIAIDALRATADPAPIAVDLGTGSGAIALAMATEVPHARVFAVEKSPDAHRWAARNFAHTGAANATLIHGDLADSLSELDGTVSVLASNPPYIPDAAVPRDVEVQRFDPPLALYGGEDGLDIVRVLRGVGERLVHPGGVIAIEHGERQGAAVRDILLEGAWRAAATHRDLTGRDRVTTALRS